MVSRVESTLPLVFAVLLTTRTSLVGGTGIDAFVAAKTILYDDSPPPHIQQQEIDMGPDRNWVQDFWQTFFHRRSGWYLKARIYLILEHCPWTLKPITLLQGTLGVMIGWLGQRLMRWSTRSLRRTKPSALPFPGGH